MLGRERMNLKFCNVHWTYMENLGRPFGASGKVRNEIKHMHRCGALSRVM